MPVKRDLNASTELAERGARAEGQISQQSLSVCQEQEACLQCFFEDTAPCTSPALESLVPTGGRAGQGNGVSRVALLVCRHDAFSSSSSLLHSSLALSDAKVYEP